MATLRGGYWGQVTAGARSIIFYHLLSSLFFHIFLLLVTHITNLSTLSLPPSLLLLFKDYDWCEKNYAISSYVAEFWNTLSSLFVLFAGLFLLRRTLQYQYGVRFIFASLGVTIIGLGSVAFHGTLRRWGQVLDEIPMLWSSLLFLWIGATNTMSSSTALKSWSMPLGLLLLVIGTLSTFMYFQGGFLFFIVTYVITVASIFLVMLFGMNTNSIARKYGLLSIAIYCFGFICLWIPEQVLCGNRIVDYHKSMLLSLPIPLHGK